MEHDKEEKAVEFLGFCLKTIMYLSGGQSYYSLQIYLNYNRL